MTGPHAARQLLRLPLYASLLFACSLVAAPLAHGQQVPQQSIYPELEGQALIDALRADYAPAQTMGYDVARDTLYAYEQRTDGALIGEYTGYTIQLDPTADPSYDAYLKGINAEHTFPQSMGAGSEPAKSDLHNLFPVKSDVNSSRSNHPYAEISDNETDTWFYQSQELTTTPSSNIDYYSERDGTHPDPNFSARFEPREDHSGDGARAVFYFYTIYQAQADDAFFDVQRQDLLDWHNSDQVDYEEYARSEFIASHQGTANPFILDTTLARRAFGSYSGGGDPPSEPPTVAADVWINELHYDNDSYDSSEGIEIAGPAGADLSGWSLVLYNGNGSSVYQTESLSGAIDDEGNGSGALWFSIAGLQNGSPDAIALVDAAGEIAQFLSYEGTLTASDGPAAGMTSTDIGVSEGSTTPAGQSLQLTGTGASYADFTWQAPSVASPGQINAEQVVEASSGTGMVWINEFHYDNDSYDEGEGVEIAGAAGTDVAGWSLVLYNGNGASSYNTVALTGTLPDQEGAYGTLWFAATLQNGSPDAIALVNDSGEIMQFLSYEGTITAADGPAAGMTSTDVGVSESSSSPVGYSLQLGGDGTAYTDFTWQTSAPATEGQVNSTQSFTGGGSSEPVQQAWINEMHYDNQGSDADEGLEIAGTAGLDLSGWMAALYNGNGGSVYTTINLSGTLQDEAGGIGFVWFAADGLQNGSPDGIALIDAGGQVVQFLSYEGEVAATDGPAAGMTSTEIGVSQSSAKKNRTLQLTGTGSSYIDFSWTGPDRETRGVLNRGQTISASASLVAGRDRGEPSAQPAAITISAPYPNPTHGLTRFSVSSASGSSVRVDVFDVLGRRVATLHDGRVPAGTPQSVTFDTNGQAAGLYVVRAVSDDGTIETRQVMVLR